MKITMSDLNSYSRESDAITKLGKCEFKCHATTRMSVGGVKGLASGGDGIPIGKEIGMNILLV